MGLLERFTAPGPKRILSLDGGGIRGRLCLGILAHVERVLRLRHGRPDLLLSDYFDLIGGTSTGAIIAAALAMGLSVDEVVDFYNRVGPHVFERRSWRPWHALYKVETLRKGLEDGYKGLTLGDPAIRTGLCIFAKRADTGGTWRLFNHPHGKFFEENRGIPLSQAVRASTAAPVYFEPEVLNVGSGQTGVFVDGSASMAGNPALQLFLIATLSGFPFHWPTGETQLLITSVGTGVSLMPHAIGPAASSAWDWASTMPSMFIQDASWHVQLLLQSFSRTQTHWTIDSEIGDLAGD
jgi:patatin-like phospholipase/acyl hydrolase